MNWINLIQCVFLSTEGDFKSNPIRKYAIVNRKYEVTRESFFHSTSSI